MNLLERLNALHWTTRALISFIVLVYPWYSLLHPSYYDRVGAGETVFTCISTACAVYWSFRPLFTRS